MKNILNSWGRGSGKTTDIMRVIEDYVENYLPIVPQTVFISPEDYLEPPEKEALIFVCMMNYDGINNFTDELNKKYNCNAGGLKATGRFSFVNKAGKKFKLLTCVHYNLEETMRGMRTEDGLIIIDEVFCVDIKVLSKIYYGISMHYSMILYGTPEKVPLSKEWQRFIFNFEITHKETLNTIFKTPGRFVFKKSLYEEYVGQVLGYMII